MPTPTPLPPHDQDGPVHVALCFDAAYVPYAGVCIHSVARSFGSRPVHFHLLASNVEEARRREIERCGPGATFSWIDMSTVELPRFRPGQGMDHVSAATLFRLCLDRLLPGSVDRLLYLDADLVAFGDLTQLWDQDLGGNAVGAVRDPDVDARQFAQAWNLSSDGAGYFNAGVLLLDLHKLAALGALPRALDFFGSHTLQYADQDALNFALWGAWTPLGDRWNLQKAMALQSARDGTAERDAAILLSGGVLHFTSGEKPWIPTAYHPWSFLFWREARKTGFAGEIARRHGFRLRDHAKLLVRWMRRGAPRALLRRSLLGR